MVRDHVKVPMWVLGLVELTGLDKLVIGVLLSAGEEPISQGDICEMLGVSRRAVGQSIARLKACDFLETDSTLGGSSAYRVLAPAQEVSAQPTIDSYNLFKGKLPYNKGLSLKDKPFCKSKTEPATADSSRVSVINEIWAAYPRRQGGAVGRRAIGLALRKVDGPTLLAAVKRFARATNGTDKKFIPLPATWFNQERWSDDLSRCPGGRVRSSEGKYDGFNDNAAD